MYQRGSESGVYLANRDIHEGRSESGDLIGPKVSCTRGRSESGDLIGPKMSCTRGALNPESIWSIVTSIKGAPNPEA
ncbi:hypothetical protein ACSBR1_026347 [Camellia fascicularis]